MSPRTNRKNRCLECQMSRLLCICSLLSEFRQKLQAGIDVQTRVVVRDSAKEAS